MSGDEYRKLVSDVNRMHEDGTIPDEKPMTDTANLEDGFYWVCRFGEWEIAQKLGGYFYRTNCNDKWFAGAFDEIDPRPIKREDVK